MGFNASALTEKTVKNFVDRLHKQNISTTPSYKRSQTQENVAIMLGYKNWHALQQAITTPKTLPNSKGTASAHQLVHGHDQKRCEFLSTFVNSEQPTLLLHGELSVPVSNWASTRFSTHNELTGNILSQINFDTMSGEDMYRVTKNFLPHNVQQDTLNFIKNLLAFLVVLRDDSQCQQKFNETTIAKFFDFGLFCRQIWRRDIPQKSLEYLTEHLQCLGISEEKYPLFNHNPNQEFLNVTHYEKRHNAICAPLQPLFFATAPKTPLPSKVVQIMETSIADTTVQKYIHWWCNTYPGGVILADGLPHSSGLYLFFLKNLAFLKSNSIGFVLGTATPHDFPTLQMYEQIKARVGDVLTLEN